MKLSTNFLKDYVDIDVDVKTLAEDMTRVGNEYDYAGRFIKATNLVVGEIKECEEHPDSDHLHVCQVDVGKEVLQIVCGAPNARKGIKVIVALPGAQLPGDFTIKRGTIRGVESNGMMCSLAELGIEAKFLTQADKEGIHELPETATVGADPIKVMKMDDGVIDFELTANRGDLLSILGMAYELGAIYDKPVKEIDLTHKENNENIVEDYLSEIDVDKSLIEELDINSYNSIEDFKEDFKKIIYKDIEVSNKDLFGKVALIGPTGVGKTTTIAKLAGRLALIEKKKVGLITIDTYRIGAVEQLKTYAEIMNIPFKVVITLKEMEESIKELQDCDVILIDTTGRSSKNTMQISELRAFIQKINADNISLVISGTTKNKDIDTILKGYGEVNYENIIITKLDETSSYGGIYNIIKKSKKDIKFISTGQNVPDDIKTPSKEELCSLILGDETIC